MRPENIFKLVGKKITVDLEEDATITDAMIKGWWSDIPKLKWQCGGLILRFYLKGWLIMISLF